MLSRPTIAYIFGETTDTRESCGAKNLAFWEGLGCISLEQSHRLAAAQAICDGQGAKMDPKTMQCFHQGGAVGGSTALAKCQPPNQYDPFKGDCLSPQVAHQRAADALACHNNGKYWDAHTASCVAQAPAETICADGKPADPQTICNRMISGASTSVGGGATEVGGGSTDSPSEYIGTESKKMSNGLILGAVVTVGLIAGGAWWMSKNKSVARGAASAAYSNNPTHGLTSLPQAPAPTFSKFPR